jgi:hypothetical protein
MNLAIAGNLTEVVKALCKREDLSFNGGFRRKSLWPPLVAAAHLGNVEILQIFLECSRFTPDDELCGNNVALEVAIRRGFQEFGEMLKNAQKQKVMEKKSKRFGWFRRFRGLKKGSKKG